MTVIIQIHYLSADSRSYQKAEIQLRGKSKERAASEFWKWIKKKHPNECSIEKIICDGEDITEAVLYLEKQEINKIMNDNLPF